MLNKTLLKTDFTESTIKTIPFYFIADKSFLMKIENNEKLKDSFKRNIQDIL